MLGPYSTNKNGTISFKGNKLFHPLKNITSIEVPISDFEKRVEQLNQDRMWTHIAKINHRIYYSTNEYFDKLGALFTALPLTTRMISSPGAFYGRAAISYTSDTCPITLKWFDLPRNAFLSESSQIYLELALIQQDINHVYSIYNSFRKEKTDSTHLSEFHHIEYEGKVSQQRNETIALGLIGKMVKDIIENNGEDLNYFLSEGRIAQLDDLANGILGVTKITFAEALDILYRETKCDKYKEFTSKHFGAWEEIKLTEIIEGMVVIREYPLLEVPFYHAVVDGKSPKVAHNSDIIWQGYREIVGSGHRVRSEKELEEKASIFNLPLDDYRSYLQTRKLRSYKETSGFGLGWERFLHGLLEMPFIWNAVQFPRVDGTLTP